MAAMAHKVTLVGDGVLIQWDTGKTVIYPYRELRLACRCAHCEDEITHERRLDPASVPESIVVVDYLMIGKYGIQFLWSDGHEAGIYTFKMLTEDLNDENSNA